MKYDSKMKARMNLSGFALGRAKGIKKPGQTGANHFNWKPKTIKHCPTCQKEMVLAPNETWRKFCSLKCRGLGKRDINSPVYKGDNGRKRLRQRIMDMPEYKEWRFQVFKRDEFKCIWCGSSKNIEGDHIKSFALLLRENEINSFEDARKCLNLWNISNGRTLCRKCHRTTDSYLKRV